MRVRSTAAAIVLSAVATLPLASIANAQPGDWDCEDFATQEEAQAFLDAQTGDPDRLDEDHDGVACEHLPSGSSTADSGQVESVPQGGLDTGDGTVTGGTTTDDAGSEVLVASGVILAGGLAVAAIRRRTARRSS